MFERIAIMGAGSLGTILGAYLGRAGKDVTLVDPYEAHVKALNEVGATVVGKADFTAPVKACTPADMDGNYDLFIYMAKQTYNETALPQMVAHCHENTIICCCQNGVPEMAVAKYWPADKICGAPIGWGATFKGPGVSELTSDEASCTNHLGAYDGKEHEWLKEVQAVLECMCPTELTNYLMVNRWTKVAINASFSGLSTVIGGTFGDVMDDPIGIQCLAMIINEVHRVTAAEGIPLAPFAGLDFGGLGGFTDAEGKAKLENAIRTLLVPHRALVASMLQDLRKGQKCEIAQIDGVVAELGDKHGIDTPFTDMVIEIVGGYEAGNGVPCIESIQKFASLLQ